MHHHGKITLEWDTETDKFVWTYEGNAWAGTYLEVLERLRKEMVDEYYNYN